MLSKTFCACVLSLLVVSQGVDRNPNDTEYYDNIDYHYTDYEETPTLQLSFSKCHCGQDQLWNGTRCYNLDPEKLENITDHLQLATKELHQTAVIANIRERNCRRDYAILPIESFVFLEPDVIYHGSSDTVFNSTDFCLEYTGTVTDPKVIAEACIIVPTVPICSSIQIESIPIHFGDTLVQVKHMDTVKQNIHCDSGHYTTINLSSNDTESSLVIVSGNLSFLWTSPEPLSTPQILSADKFCIGKDESITVSFCYKDPIEEEEEMCKNTSCLRKCCKQDLVFDMVTMQCLPSPNNTWTPTTQGNYSLHMLYGYPWCSHQSDLYQLDPKTDPGSTFDLLENGSIHVTLTNVLIPYSQFCIDNFQYSDSSLSEKALVCFGGDPEELEQPSKCKQIHSIIYPILIVISCTFLAITLVVYASVPELYANLHGKSLLSHVTSLLIGYICQLIVAWNSRDLSMLGCKVIGLGTQVSFLWAFFWLNVMCFDIWWTLKSMSPSPETWETSRRRFILYSVYAWGCPLVIGSITAIMEFVPDARTQLIVPGFGIRSCWFQDVKATWIYFHGFTLLLYVLNILFFFHVAAILITSQRSTEGILRITRKQYQERVFLYLKLFVVMGVTWICEVASWQEGTCEYWIFTDVVNSLQGMFLFFIFMCNKKVFLKVQAKSSPFLRRIKAFVKPQSLPKVASNSSTSQRTTQTSMENSSRRLSTSSVPSSIVKFALRATKSGDSESEADKDTLPKST